MAALLEWQPLMHLQQENYQLREENRYLHFQVKELLAWKERAVRHMVSLAPKRSKAQREIKHATQLQKQLHAVEKTLQERVALEETTHVLEQKEHAMVQQLETLEHEKQKLVAKCDRLRLREGKLTEGLQSVSDMFRVHLEKLVAIRETIDTSIIDCPTAEASGSSPLTALPQAAAADTGDEGVESTASRGNRDGAATQHAQSSTAIMIAGLHAVSEKCLHWFHEHVEQTFTQQQQKAELYESQHTELLRLRTKVETVQQDRLESASNDQRYHTQVAHLQHVNAQLERELVKFQTRYVGHSQGQTQLGDQMRLLVTEIRQYLRLVRVEIKKKFGYVPEAIAHAESWSRILDALDALERHVRLASVT